MNRRLRDLVWRRADRRCEYCHMPQDCDPISFEIDHVIPQKHGGPTTDDNLALACFTCNNHKGPNLAGSDPETNQIVPLFNPRRDDWAAHFRWESAFLIGSTPCGRATVAVLDINLPHRVAHREALMDEGVHPK
jgi:5-methylcytosine-specific restriction endonuclease McrA